ncbi:MAG TPA: alpha/beta hydrolase [Nitrososphaeraceae archaeon]|nr:alpha/beta hydrolase [Nitrososphaeraceae archaeon]
MKKIFLDNAELEYNIFQSTTKESVNSISSIEDNIILIHGGIIADANIPLVTFSNILTKNYNILHYHRRGYGKSINKRNNFASIFQHVEDCKEIMDLLNIEKAHIVGHSLGGAIALQLTSNYPDHIESLILLEPAITGYNEINGQQVIHEFEPVIQMYDKGQKKEAIDIFMKKAIGSNYKEIIANVLPPNSFELAVTDAKTFFHEEIPSMKAWIFTKNQAKDLLHKKILHIRGIQKARKISKDREDLLNYWLPQTMTISIPNAPHMLQITNPKEVVQTMNIFLHNVNRF